MTSSVLAPQFRCQIRTIERLRDRFRQTGTTSDRLRLGRPRVTTRRQSRNVRASHQRNRYRPVTVTARRTQETHNPRFSAQTVRNRMREIGVRSGRPHVFIHSGVFIWPSVFSILMHLQI